MFRQETADDIGSKDEGNSTIAFCPACNVLVGVCPQEVTDHACVWNVCWTHQAANLIKAGNFWRQATVHAHDLFINEATHGHAIEDVAELLPHLDVVATLAFVVEAVDPEQERKR